MSTPTPNQDTGIDVLQSLINFTQAKSIRDLLTSHEPKEFIEKYVIKLDVGSRIDLVSRMGREIDEETKKMDDLIVKWGEVLLKPAENLNLTESQVVDFENSTRAFKKAFEVSTKNIARIDRAVIRLMEALKVDTSVQQSHRGRAFWDDCRDFYAKPSRDFLLDLGSCFMDREPVEVIAVLNHLTLRKSIRLPNSSTYRADPLAPGVVRECKDNFDKVVKAGCLSVYGYESMKHFGFTFRRSGIFVRGNPPENLLFPNFAGENVQVGVANGEYEEWRDLVSRDYDAAANDPGQLNLENALVLRDPPAGDRPNTRSAARASYQEPDDEEDDEQEPQDVDRRKIATPSCNCKLSDEWKLAFIEDNFSIKRALELVGDIMPFIKDMKNSTVQQLRPCIFHVGLLVEAFGLRHDTNTEGLVIRLGQTFELCEGRRTLKRAWVDSRVGVHFIPDARIEEYRQAMSNRGRFTQRDRDTVNQEWETKIRKAASELTSELGENGNNMLSGEHFKWVKDSGILWRIFKEEINMYLHHSRDNQRGGCMIDISFHSLLGQIIRCDPLTYVMNVKHRPDSEPYLISIPSPLMHITRSKTFHGLRIDACQVRGAPEIYNLTTFGGGTASCHSVDDWEEAMEQLGFGDQGRALESVAAVKEVLNVLEPCEGYEEIVVPNAPGAFATWLAGRAVEIKHARNSSECIYVFTRLISAADPEGCENAVDLRTIQQEARSLKFPGTLADGSVNRVQGTTFPADVNLSGLPPLSMSLLGLSGMRESAVNVDRLAWLKVKSLTPEEQRRKVLDYRTRLTLAVQEAWEFKKNLEEAAFGDKSWVRSGKEKLAPDQLLGSSDDSDDDVQIVFTQAKKKKIMSSVSK